MTVHMGMQERKSLRRADFLDGIFAWAGNGIKVMKHGAEHGFNEGGTVLQDGQMELH